MAEHLETRRLLSYGTDSYFGNGGVGLIPFTGGYEASTDVATTSDGHIYVAGTAHGAFGLARLDFNGQLDPSFGGTGYVINPDPPYSQHDVTAVAVQSDGKVLLGGDTPYQFAVFRYNGDGSLDKSFGANGLAATGFAYSDYLAKLLVQPDGRILAFGYSNNGNHFRAAILRYNTDGSLDSSFGTGGKLIYDFGPTLGLGSGASSEFVSGVLLPSGKILLDGFAGSQALITQLNSDGSLDPGFGAGGIVHFSSIAGISVNDALAITLCPTGGFYTALSTFSSGHTFGIAKWDGFGSFDPAFGNNGFFAVGLQSPVVTADLAVQPDSSVVVFGQYGLVNNFSIDTVDPLGHNDLNSIVAQGGARTGTAGIALQPDGRTVVAPGFWMPGIPATYGAGVFRYRTMADRPQGVWLEGSIVTILGENPGNTVYVTHDGAFYDLTLDGVTTGLPTSLVSLIDVRLLGERNLVVGNPFVPLNVVDMGNGTVNTANFLGGALYAIHAGTGGDVVDLSMPEDESGSTQVIGDASDKVVLSGSNGVDLFSVVGNQITAPGRAVYLSGIGHVDYYAGDGNDTISINAPSGPSVTVHGGNGNDSYSVVGGGPISDPDVIYTGKGTNQISVATAPSSALQMMNDPDGVDSIRIVSNLNAALSQSLSLTDSGFTTTTLDSFTIATPSAIVELTLADSGNTMVFLRYSTIATIPDVLRFDGIFTVSSLDGADPLPGKLIDIEQSTIYIEYLNGLDPIAAVQRYLRNGYDNGTWTGVPTPTNGVITSSTAAADPEETTAIGYTDSGGLIRLEYTLYGDTGLQRTVGFADFSKLSQSYQSGNQTWATGDFNYDGTVDFADFSLLTRTYGRTLGAPAASSVAVAAIFSSAATPAPSAVSGNDPQPMASARTITALNPCQSSKRSRVSRRDRGNQCGGMLRPSRF